MATIEPRLIYLMNDTQTPMLPPIQLPPSPPPPSPPHERNAGESLSLPPLDHNQAHRGEDKAVVPTPMLPLLAASDDALRKPSHPAMDNALSNIDAPSGGASGQPTKPGHPLQMLLDDNEANTSTPSLPIKVDGANSVNNANNVNDVATADTADNADGANNAKAADDTTTSGTKKRHRASSSKEDFVQLPQPVKKKQKATTQQVMPPIIAGLRHPPPNAAVFPPITPNIFGAIDPLGPHFGAYFEDRFAENGADANGPAKGKRRAAKPRRKWTDEETNQLLLGVSRHGVGKWTNILDDPDFVFNDRTAGDLKDRFRTCCPDELRGNSAPGGSNTSPPSAGGGEDDGGTGNEKNLEDEAGSVATGGNGTPYVRIRPKVTTTPERQHEPCPAPAQPSDATQPPKESESQSPPANPPAQRQRRSRAHRKKMTDLMDLGIHGPFKKSHRRERRTFTGQDDREILEGLDRYGPAWTKIQRDRRFNLSTRQPTDLRDRVRNKYPQIYQRIEKNAIHAAKGALQAAKTDASKPPSASPLEPAVRTTADGILQPKPVTPPGPKRLSARQAKARQGPSPPKRLLPAGYIDPMESPLPGPLPGLSDMFDMSPPPLPVVPGMPGMPGIAGIMGAATACGFLGPSEMDISRLLLDDGSAPDYQHHSAQQQQLPLPPQQLPLPPQPLPLPPQPLTLAPYGPGLSVGYDNSTGM